MKQNKKGSGLPLEVVIGIILAVLFLVIFILLYKPVASPQFQLGVKEQICRYSIAASQIPALSIQPLCHTQIISFTEKNINKAAQKGETTKDAGIRQLLDYMLRCKTMVNGPKRTGFLSENSCYICYSLQTDATTPRITEEDLATSSVRLRSPTGKSYFYELNSDNHWPTAMLNGGLGITKTETFNERPLSLGKDYAITYVSANKGSFWSTVGTATTGAGGCVLGAAMWFIPTIGPPLALTAGSLICEFSLASTGLALFDILKPSEQAEGTVLFTDYTYLQQHACGVDAHVIS